MDLIFVNVLNILQTSKCLQTENKYDINKLGLEKIIIKEQTQL